MKHPQGDESFAIDGEVVVVAARPRKRVTDDQRRGTRATRYCKYPPAEEDLRLWADRIALVLRRSEGGERRPASRPLHQE